MVVDEGESDDNMDPVLNLEENLSILKSLLEEVQDEINNKEHFHENFTLVEGKFTHCSQMARNLFKWIDSLSDKVKNDVPLEKQEKIKMLRKEIEQLIKNIKKAFLQAEVINFENAAEILFGDQYGDKVKAITDEVSEALKAAEEISDYSDKYTLYVEQKALDYKEKSGYTPVTFDRHIEDKFKGLLEALENLRALGNDCANLVHEKDEPKGALQHLTSTLHRLFMEWSEPALALEASRLKNLANRYDPSRSTLQAIGDQLLRAVIFLRRMITKLVLGIKAYWEDVPVTHRMPNDPNEELKQKGDKFYEKKGMRPKFR